MLDWVKDPGAWTWITDPIDIIVIFTTAIMGMFAFASATQGYYVIKTKLYERLLFLCAVPLFFLPNITTPFLKLPHEYLSYLLGFALFVALYLNQKYRQKRLAAQTP